MAEREANVPEDRRIRYRIGINIGDVIIDDGDIYGDGVNVAARLEGLAEPGGICIARNVHNQVKNKLAFGFEPMGEHRVKNIAEPVTVYRVVAERGPFAKVIRLRRAGTYTWRWAALAAAAAIVVIAGGASWWYADQFRSQRLTSDGSATVGSVLSRPDKPSIAVLPFDNLGGDQATGRLADRATEDIIADLAPVRITVQLIDTASGPHV